MVNNILKVAFVLSTVVVIYSSCKKKTITPPVSTVDVNAATFENIKTHLFAKSCASNGCHNTAAASNIQHGLVLEGTDVYERIINVNPKNTNALTAKLKLVKPNTPDSSFLFTKCDWNNYTQYHFGNQMPLGADLLTTSQIKYIKDWIVAGAPKTGIVADANLIK